MFQNTLTEAALRWFLNLNDTRARSWEDIHRSGHNKEKSRDHKARTERIFLCLHYQVEVQGSIDDEYFPNFKVLITAGTQIEDAINNGTIENDDPLRFKKNLGSNSKAAEVSNIHKNDPYQLIAPIAHVQVSQGPLPRPRREFHELYMPISQKQKGC